MIRNQRESRTNDGIVNTRSSLVLDCFPAVKTAQSRLCYDTEPGAISSQHPSGSSTILSSDLSSPPPSTHHPFPTHLGTLNSTLSPAQPPPFA